jgi:uncharacterized membrane protein YfcA
LDNQAQQTYREFPRWVYWLLFASLWGLVLATIVALYLRRNSLQPWKVYLYGGLLAVYLWAEKRAHREPATADRRAHE